MFVVCWLPWSSSLCKVMWCVRIKLISFFRIELTTCDKMKLSLLFTRWVDWHQGVKIFSRLKVQLKTLNVRNYWFQEFYQGLIVWRRRRNLCQRSRGNPLLSLDYKDSDIVIFLTLMKIIKDELWPWPI